jgi:hypothetical protein
VTFYMVTSFSLSERIKKSGRWSMRKGPSLARPKFSKLVPEPGVASTLPKGTATPITPRMTASITSMVITRAMGLLGLLLEAASSLKGLSTALKCFGKFLSTTSYPLDLDILSSFPYSNSF